MNTNEMALYISNETGLKFYPVRFPDDSIDDACYVRFSGGNRHKAGIDKVQIQIVARANHPAVAENNSCTIMNFLDNKTMFNINNWHIIRCAANNPFPMFIGEDENNRFLYSINFTLLMEGEL